jgi:1-acyl-sn-glycerol-3-phosphate acyltransferase
MIRVLVTVPTFLALWLTLLPVQLAGIALNSRLQRDVPHLFHRILCRVIGIRIREVGARTRESPVLILSNHASWIDICVLGAVAPVVFVAKSEVARWPVFGWLAKLQRTIFIERERRQKTGDAARAMADRLIGGDAVVLFPEGTSSDGIRVLPFRSALIGAVHHAIGDSTHHDRVMVQPVSLAYVGYGGVPVGRALRDKVAWYGEAPLVPHLVGVLACGAIDVTVSWGEATAYDVNADRKQIAREAETAVRQMTSRVLRPPTAATITARTKEIATPAANGIRALACARCGAAFTCDLSGACWCVAEAARLPMPTDGEDCLCPACLRAATAEAAPGAAARGA